MKEMSTKERILYAALDLFAENGYDGTGVDLIAETAGIKGPSLYRHYKGKEDIFNSLMDTIASHYEEGFGLRQNPDEFPKTKEELIESAMKKIQFTMHDDIICKTRRILAMEQFRNERVAKLTSFYHLENLLNVYKNVFAVMMEKGILKKDNPELLALEFISPISMLIHLNDRQPERESEVLLKIREHLEHFANTY